MRIKGRNAIVTGASSGIGRAVALDLAKRGAKVALVARRADVLRQVAEEARELGAEVLEVPCDVTDAVQVEEACAEIRRRIGQPDILVNAAGMAVWRRFTDISDGEHQEMMAVNYWGTFHWIRNLLPGMRAARRGRIVAIASGSGLFALPVTSGYSASKFAVVGLCEALRRELFGTGVGVSVVNPGSVKTPFWNERNIPARLLPPLVRYSPKLSPAAVARTVRSCIWIGFPIRTVPVFVNLLAKANGLWIRLGDLLLWRWFFPVALALVLARILVRILSQ